MKDRDPRMDPAVGDVVKASGEYLGHREVTDLFDEGQHVFFRSGQGYGRIYFCTRDTWRTWAVGAKVIRKGT